MFIELGQGVRLIPRNSSYIYNFIEGIEYPSLDGEEEGVITCTRSRECLEYLAYIS